MTTTFRTTVSRPTLLAATALVAITGVTGCMSVDSDAPASPTKVSSTYQTPKYLGPDQAGTTPTNESPRHQVEPIDPTGPRWRPHGLNEPIMTVNAPAPKPAPEAAVKPEPTPVTKSQPTVAPEPAPVATPAHKPVEALTDVSSLPFTAKPVAPGVNVFGEFDGQPVQTNTTVAGRAGYTQHTFVDEGWDGDVSVSPDGEWLAFASTRHNPTSDIYLQRVNGVAVTKLTADPADDAFPTFSPDGRRIAFASNRSGNWDIYVMNADGKHVTAVTSGFGQDLHPSFSPDGTRLAFCRSGGRSGQWELWVADLTSGERTMVGYGLFPAWSPRRDKDVIAFQRARQRGTRWFSLWTLDLVNGEPTNVTEVAVSTNSALVAPTWAPGGEKLAFATVVEPTGGNPAVAGQQDIWTVNADGSDRQRLTDGKGVYATPYWATDGRVYFVSNRGGTESIWSARAEGHNFSTAAIDVAPTH